MQRKSSAPCAKSWCHIFGTFCWVEANLIHGKQCPFIAALGAKKETSSNKEFLNCWLFPQNGVMLLKFVQISPIVDVFIYIFLVGNPLSFLSFRLLLSTILNYEKSGKTKWSLITTPLSWRRVRLIWTSQSFPWVTHPSELVTELQFSTRN